MIKNRKIFQLSFVLSFVLISAAGAEEMKPASEIASLIVQQNVYPPQESLLEKGMPLSDTGSTIGVVLVHAYSGSAKDPLLANLMQAFERTEGAEPIRWLVTVTGRDQAREIAQSLRERGVSDLRSRIRFLVMPEPCNPWTRDLYLTFENPKANTFGIHALDRGREECGQKIADVLSQSDPGWNFRIQKVSAGKGLPLAGGDVAIDDEYVYVGKQSMERLIRNDKHSSRKEAIAFLEIFFQKKVIVLPGENDHLDRYFVPLGVIEDQRTALVADPVAVFRMIAEMTPAEKDLAIETVRNAYFSRNEKTIDALRAFFYADEAMVQRIQETAFARSLDETAKLLTEKGMRVIRIPALHRNILKEGYFPVGFYYTNLVQDVYRGENGEVRRRLIVPAYEIPALDGRVQEILESLEGIDEIKTVSVIRESYLFAGIRCLVQVFGKSPQSVQA